MEIKEMSIDQIEERLSAIEVEKETEGADLQALLDETRALAERKSEIIASAEQRKAELDAIASEDTKTDLIKTFEERKEMSVIEVRNTKEYIDQFAEYIKTEKRGALLSENATNGTVAVPDMVYDIVKTAWDKEGIMKRVKKSYLAGNLKVGFEISATGAAIHAEGAEAPTQETLVLGIVNLVPQSIKKWITVSDEVLDLRGEAFLRYIYDELTYQIAKKAAKELLDKIIACGTVSTTTQVSVPVVTEATIALGTIAKAIAELSDEADNPIIVMNKATWASFKAAQYAGDFNIDVFEGLEVEFNNSLASYATAGTGDTYVIVGDFGQGALANFPNGEDIKFKFDDKSLAESDLVKIVGREYVAVEPVAPNAFVKIVK